MSALVDARADLYDAVLPAFEVPVVGYDFAGRVHRTQPDRLVAPCAFIGPSSSSTVTGQRGSRTLVVEFPVWVVYDGSVQAQVDGIEEVLGRLMAAALSGGVGAVPAGHRPSDPPGSPSTGATTPKAAVLTVEMSIPLLAQTFRVPDLMEAASA